MARTAAESVDKWVERAGTASDEYLAGARNPARSQSQSAIAAADLALQGIIEAFKSGRWEKGLRESGDAGWLEGIEQKGVTNYLTGVSSERAKQKYVTNSGRYDSARNAAAGMARGPKGSAQNLAKVTKVVQALRAAKVGR